jgi:uncharacterized protein (UPF0210 family)
MTHSAKSLSPEQRAAAELLLGRPLADNEAISVQAFEPVAVSEDLRRDVSAKLNKLFAEVDRSLKPATSAEAEEVFAEAMRSSRPEFRIKT